MIPVKIDSTSVVVTPKVKLTVKVTVGQFDRFISQDEKDRLERKKKDDEARKAAEEQQDPAKAANPSPSKLGKPAK